MSDGTGVGTGQEPGISNIIRSFRYWPRVFQMLWTISPGYLLIMSVINLLQGFLPALSIQATQQMINSISAGHSEMVSALLFFLAIAVVYGLTSTSQNYFETLYQTKLSNHINVAVIEKSTTLSLEDFENAEMQDQLKRVQNESGFRPFQIAKQIFSILSNVISLISISVIIVSWSWWAAVILIIVPAISFFTFLKIGQQEFVNLWSRASKSRSAWYLSYLISRDNTFKEVKLYNLGAHFTQKYKAITDGFFKQDKKLAANRVKYASLYELIEIIASFTVIVLAMLSALRGALPVGNVVAILQSITQIQSRSEAVVQELLALCQNNLYLEQLFTFLDYEEKRAFSITEGEKLHAIKDIEFRDVSFQYSNSDHYALHNLNFTIRTGQKIAIVGHNGSGKSTLIKLLMKLYQQSAGRILVNGQDINHWNIEDYQRRIGVVFQDFVQYEMSVRQNIGYGNIQEIENEEKILTSAQYAGIQPLVQSFPRGLDTQLGLWFEEGHQLSGGQWQRIAIARAFMREADVYILDEPSSFLDPEAERDVFERMGRLIEDRIGIFISHRLSSVNFADQIWVMDQGEIIEMGTHRELMALNGNYARMYRIQAESYASKEQEEEVLHTNMG
ncbi:ABC transporter ATP-binding protein [Paenibacillus bovis]|uniref:ABC transporter ATP-binding protein n=2 Tax=Paenibacillus bovis TaxID=1616788 RepID=A0A172ZBD0_9BACL|nr:ABC transporter ATP-binding protein [Paenibacillus bovis]